MKIEKKIVKIIKYKHKFGNGELCYKYIGLVIFAE